MAHAGNLRRLRTACPYPSWIDHLKSYTRRPLFLLPLSSLPSSITALVPDITTTIRTLCSGKWDFIWEIKSIKANRLLQSIFQFFANWLLFIIQIFISGPMLLFLRSRGPVKSLGKFQKFGKRIIKVQQNFVYFLKIITHKILPFLFSNSVIKTIFSSLNVFQK